jgi:ATPase subunit of ABC transporter with duplicated ATPase domains
MISFSDVNKQYRKQLLFVDASFQLIPGEKVGLVGPNGAGKTTLFRMVVGEETPDEGAVSVPKNLTIGYFRQDVEEMQGRQSWMKRSPGAPGFAVFETWDSTTPSLWGFSLAVCALPDDQQDLSGFDRRELRA